MHINIVNVYIVSIVIRTTSIYYIYIEVIRCKLLLYLKKAGLDSQNIVHY